MDQTLDILLTKHTPKSPVIEANPWDAIPIKNIKQAKNTTEVHLGNRQATVLVKFVDFPNLQILWINQNKLQTLDGLDKNFRIKHLYAQENRIKSFDNRILQKLKHIQTLIIYDNQLRDLDKIIKQLRQLKNLQRLDMFNNPAAHEPNYKFRVIHALPTLEIFDRHKISQKQRLQAEEFMSSRGKKQKKQFKKYI